MERVGNRRVEDFPATTLFLDDFRDIIHVFQDACQRVEIDAGDYKITDTTELDDLAKRFPKGRFDAIELQGYDPYVSVSLWPHAVRAYMSDDTPVQMGIIAKVREIVDRGKRWRPLTLMLLVGVVVLGGSFGSTVSFALDRPVLGTVAMTAAIAVWIATYAVLRSQRNVVVFTRERGAQSGFLKTNRDQIILILIAAGAGSLITVAATYLISKVLP